MKANFLTRVGSFCVLVMAENHERDDDGATTSVAATLNAMQEMAKRVDNGL